MLIHGMDELCKICATTSRELFLEYVREFNYIFGNEYLRCLIDADLKGIKRSVLHANSTIAWAARSSITGSGNTVHFHGQGS